MRATLFAKLLRRGIAGAWLVAGVGAQAAESDRWLALFAAVPELPAAASDALPRIAARRAAGQVRIEIGDAALRRVQREADELYEPAAQASAAQFRQRLDEINRDPEVAAMARRIGAVTDPIVASGAPPTPEQRQAVSQVLERELSPGAVSGAASAPLSDIAALRLERMRAQPRPGQFLRQLFAQQRRYAEQHAQSDREALARPPDADPNAPALALVARHHALAESQLADARVIFAQARAALRPGFERMAQLARAAEARNASPAERVQAYAMLKADLELLLTLQRETLQDVGFWAGVRARPIPPGGHGGRGSAWYELSLAPEVDLLANAALPAAGPHYPAGRAIVVGLPPGIR